MIPNIYEKLIIPKKYHRTSIRKKEAEYIYNFLKENKIKKTLEIGLAYGRSASYIISATNSHHYAIDPFQNKPFNNLGIKNIKRLNLNNHLRFENDFSHNVLPKFLSKGMKFDFVFIDGDHKFDSIFVDFYYVDLVLKQKGYVLFHDSWMQSIQTVCSWIKNNKRNYKRIKTPINNLIMFQKIGIDNREWNHFKLFFTLKSIFLQKVFNLFNKNIPH